MGTQQQAHKLITVSLEKIASSRRKRCEMSLHKNLLVTTVIHKARLAIIEEDRFYYNNNNNNHIIQYDCPQQQITSEEVMTNCYSQPMYHHQPIHSDYQVEEDESMLEDDEEAEDDEEPEEQHYVDMDDNRMEWISSNQHLYRHQPELLLDTNITNDKENLSPEYVECSEETDEGSRLNDFMYRGEKRSHTLNSCSVDDQIYYNYSVKRLKNWDPNEMIDQDDSTSHTLRLVSVLSATLSSSTTNNTTSRTMMMTSSELCSKQAKDSSSSGAMDITLYVNRPIAV